MRWLIVAFIKLLRRFVSPLYGDVCRYYPSCSAYGLRAVEFHGALKGSWLTIRRIASCHPWAEGGVQFVPGTPEAADWAAEQARRAAGPTLDSPSPRGEDQPEIVPATTDRSAA